jgi:hypothetical protein
VPWLLQVTINVPFPEGKLVYDYVFEPARMKWGAWLDRLEQKPVADSDAEYSSIIVPTGKMRMDTSCLGHYSGLAKRCCRVVCSQVHTVLCKYNAGLWFCQSSSVWLESTSGPFSAPSV